MTKAELIEKMARDANISKAAAGAVLESFIRHVTAALKRGERITLVGFGTFQLVRRKARRGRNPMTGQPLHIGPQNVVKFAAAPALKDAMTETEKIEPMEMEETMMPEPSEMVAPAPREPEPVFLGASSPQSVRPGGEFTARFAAYVKEMEQQVRKVLQDLSPRSETYLGLKQCRWQPGTRVNVVLSGRHLEIDEAQQEFEWNGRFNLMDFDVSVSESAPEETVVMKYDVYVDEIRLAKLRVDLEISKKPTSGQTVTRQTEPAQSAFASYSSQDRQRVLDRVAAVRTSAGLDIFMDCLDLHPGEQWKPRLHSEILKRDLFMLFWSRHTLKSQWVEWEWTTAYEEKGTEAFQLHPLDPAQDAPPPEKLAELHFDDPLMMIRKAHEKKNGGT